MKGRETGYLMDLLGSHCLLHILLLLLIFVDYSRASWLYLGIGTLAVHSRHEETCTGVPGLVYQQVEICKNNPDAIMCVGEGVRRGIYECKNQFQFERWNCSTTPNTSVFGPVIHMGTRETAFIHAVTTAGVVHAVTQSCSAGNLTDCACDMSRYGEEHVDGWKWGGCSDNVEYGIWFAQTFADAPEKEKNRERRDLRSLVNLHNNQVGRNTVEHKMTLRCRCHGVSGSCAVKSCWRSMSAFRDIGDHLKHLYESPIQVAPRSYRKLRRRERAKRNTPVDPDQLVYVDKSPDYCRRDMNSGIPGTRGRQCKKDSRGPDSCDTLCCGRGYNTHVERHIERCHCKFVWCCSVKCKLCETVIDINTCK